MPNGTAYLAAAHWGPMADPVAAVADAAIARRRAPWALDAEDLRANSEHVRGLAAALISATPDDIAIVGSVSYAMATAARNIRLARGSRVLVLEGEHPSNFLAWQDLAREQGATLDVVPFPSDGDLTGAILQRIEATSAQPIGLAALSPVHWAFGGAVDLAAIAPALRRQSALFVIDATQSAGIQTIDVRQLAPDYLAFPTYKWLGGPYGIAFLYVAPEHQDGVPLEQTMRARRTELADGPAGAIAPYIATARRFDRGERDDVTLAPTAAASLEFAKTWRSPEMLAVIRDTTHALANELAALGLPLSVPPDRTSHILSVQPRTMSATTVAMQLAAENVHVSARLGLLRISPHVYNDADDVQRLLNALRRLRSV